MKLQLDIFLSKIKKEYVWLLILIVLITGDLILKWVNVNRNTSSLLQFLSLIGFPSNKEYSFTEFLIFIYQFVVIIYYVYIYYVHDLNNSFEQIVLRTKENQWIKNRIALSGLFVAGMSAIYVLVIYAFFSNEISFEIKYLIYPVTYHIVITYLVITIINFVKRRNYLIYPLLIMFVYFTFSMFNIYVSLIIILLLLLINIRWFHFKRYYNNIH